MVKITMATGPESCSLSRYLVIVALAVEYFWFLLKDKLIPAFEAAHGPGYQALFLIDNSQGHSTHGQDALLVSQMNIHPDGKQAHMHDSWFI